MSGGRQRADGVSTDLAQLLQRLGPEERSELAALLRQPNTFIAEDMDDLLAILRDLDD